jgi:uncharacterized membrane protein (UPF0182 family)
MSLPRRRRWLLYILGVVVILAILFTVTSGFYVDLQWYREVQLSSVFWTTLRTKFLLGLVFGLIFFVLLYANLLIARRLMPSTRILTPDQEVVERIRETFDPYLRWIMLFGAALLAFIVGVGVAHEWQTFLLWRSSSGVAFGNPEPLFNRDPAYYVFTLPWFKFLQGWLFSSLVGVFFLTGIAHFLFGGIRPQAPGLSDKVTPAVRAHLSVLLGLIMLVKAWGYYLGRFDLLTSKRGVVEGASYTDVHAQLPALNFLVIVALICAVLFFLNIRLRIWALPIIAVGLLAVVSVLLGTAYPAFIQRFHVAPQEYQAEQPYIHDNIEATQTAFGLNKILFQVNRPVDTTVTASDVQKNQPTIQNIRLWRPAILQENYQALQRFRQYYEFPDVDVDRYTLNGQESVQMVSPREVTQHGIPTGGGTWQNQHLVYTHGYAAVASDVNSATTEGAPNFTVSNIPPTGTGPQVAAADQNKNAVYYGEGTSGDAAFVIVNSKTPELNYEGGPPVPYTGGGGIPMGNFFERALFAWRFKDVNLLISDQITAASRIMIYRSIEQRVPRPVPFLKFDADPYIVIEPDGIHWIWDAYTTTDQYPYSQSVNLSDATQADLPTGGLTGSANYIRNSVKVDLNAYTGKMTYYANLSDPIIKVWSQAFPGLFQNISTAKPDIAAHFRYPENLFQVQATQFATYHVTDTSVFYQKQAVWQIPSDPTVQPPAQPAGIRPYYVLMKLTGDTTEHFWLIMPFVPQGRQNMVSWMAADSDPPTPGSNYSYGSVVAAQFPTGENIDGPAQVFSRMNQDPTFSAQRSLLDQGGSHVLFGDFLVIPVENSFLYVQPVYVRSSTAQGTTAVPELKRVIVANGTAIGLGNTLHEALVKAVVGQIPGGGNNPGGGTGPGNGGSGSVNQRISSLLQQALDHFTAAQAALKNGDLAAYQSELNVAQSLVQKAETLAGQSSTTPGSPTPTPTSSASASP